MKPRQIRDIGDATWDEIKAEAARRGEKVGEYLSTAHRYLKANPTPPPTGRVRAVTPVRGRVMYACKHKGCPFHTSLRRPCPTHPHAGLKEVF